MTNVELHISTELLTEMLRLTPIRAQIIGSRLNSTDGVMTLTIATPDAPTDATGMQPVYSREWPSDRYFMTDPGWTFGGAQ